MTTVPKATGRPGAPYANPRPAFADDLRAVLHAAWAGEPPGGG